MSVLITHPTSPAHQQRPQTQAATTKPCFRTLPSTPPGRDGDRRVLLHGLLSPLRPSHAQTLPPHPRPLLALSPSLPEGARAGEEPAAESPCRPPPHPGPGWTARVRPAPAAVLEPRSHLAAARVATQATSGDPAGSCVRGRPSLERWAEGSATAQASPRGSGRGPGMCRCTADLVCHLRSAGTQPVGRGFGGSRSSG